MTSQRISNVTISMSNIKAAVETFLRQTGVIKNNEDVKLLTFITIKNPTTIVEWETMKTVPIQIITEEEEVTFIKIP